MCEILVNDIFDELRDENQRLSNELAFERQLNEILEKIKSYSIVLKNNCNCSENIEVFKKLNDLEIDYKILKSKQKSIKSEVNDNLSANTSGVQTSSIKSRSQELDLLFKNGNNSSNTVSSELICNECQHKFSSDLDLVLHINRHHKGIDSFVCHQCKQVFDSKEVFATHLSQHKSGGTSLLANKPKFKTKSITGYLRSYRKPNTSANSLISSSETSSKEKLTKSDNNMRLITEMLKPRSNSHQRNSDSGLLSAKKIKIESRVSTSHEVYCPGCQMGLDSYSALETHIKDSHPSLICGKCQQMFYSKEEVSAHLSTAHKPELLCCPFCEYTTPSKFCIARHKRTKACLKGPYRCRNPGCKCGFLRPDNLEIHKTKCKFISNNNNPEESQLEADPQLQTDQTGGEGTMRGQLSCSLCSFKTKVRFYMNRHQTTCHSSGRPFKCDIDGCINAYKKRNHLIDHQRKSHKFVSDDSQMNLLREMTKNIRNVSKLDFSEDNTEENNTTEPTEELIVSGIAQDIKLEFISDSDNESSILKTSPQKASYESVCDNSLQLSEGKHSCKLCHFKTETKIYLMLHEIQDHPELRPFKCEFPNCGKAYARRDHLREHIRRTHNKKGKTKAQNSSMPSVFKASEGANLFVCKICSYKTQYEHLLRRHSVIHSDKCFKCDFEGCVYSAHRKDVLKTHQRRVHKTAVGPNFICNYPNCRRGFDSQLLLRQHMNSHKNRFVCRWEGCQFRTDTFAKLNEHRRNESHMPTQLL